MTGIMPEIEGYKRALDVVSDAELAAILGYQRSTIAQWKKRDAIPASARRLIRHHIDLREENNRAARAFSAMPPSMRQFSKALVISYLVATTLEEDGDLEPSNLLFRAMEMDRFEIAACRVLSRYVALGKHDLASAFREALASSSFVVELAEELTTMNRESAAGSLPQSLPQP